MEHTPTPWHSHANSWQYTTISDAANNDVCRLDLEDWGVTEENQDELEARQAAVAALIVRAVNNFEQLLAALKAACRDADFGLEEGDPFPSWYEPAVNAIAKAEGR